MYVKLIFSVNHFLGCYLAGKYLNKSDIFVLRYITNRHISLLLWKKEIPVFLKISINYCLYRLLCNLFNNDN